jgi:hypothetical protein
MDEYRVIHKNKSQMKTAVPDSTVSLRTRCSRLTPTLRILSAWLRRLQSHHRGGGQPLAVGLLSDILAVRQSRTPSFILSWVPVRLPQCVLQERLRRVRIGNYFCVSLWAKRSTALTARGVAHQPFRVRARANPAAATRAV